jgi:hypothetical protein
MKTILFDVDGVLADFIYGFTRTAMVEFGTPIIGTYEQETWADIAGLDKKQIDYVWKRIKTDPNWWSFLPALVSEEVFRRINKLHDTHQVVFCTHREQGTPNCQWQTVTWLQLHGIMRPTVIVSKRKGDVAKAIDADFAIDDKPENVACIHWIADVKPCRTFILDRLYNNRVELPSKICRVQTVFEFLEAIR